MENQSSRVEDQKLRSIALRNRVNDEIEARKQRQMDLQNEISLKKHQAYVGKTIRCLVDGRSDDPRNNLTARTPGGRLVHFTGDEKLIGTYQNLTITGCSTWALFGETAE